MVDLSIATVKLPEGTIRWSNIAGKSPRNRKLDDFPEKNLQDTQNFPAIQRWHQMEKISMAGCPGPNPVVSVMEPNISKYPNWKQTHPMNYDTVIGFIHPWTCCLNHPLCFGEIQSVSEPSGKSHLTIPHSIFPRNHHLSRGYPS